MFCCQEEVDRINKVDEDCLLEDLDVQVSHARCSLKKIHLRHFKNDVLIDRKQVYDQ